MRPRVSQLHQSGATAGQVVTWDNTAMKWAPATPDSSRTIEDEGVALPSRTALDFQGPGVTVTDDATNAKTVVTIPGGSGASLGATRVYATGTPQAFTANTRAAVKFNNEEYDDLTAHDNVTNNTRLTINAAGRYRLTAQAGVATSTFLGLDIWKNGTATGTRLAATASVRSGTNIEILAQIDSGIVTLAAGDYLEVTIISASASNIDGPGQDVIWASLERLT